MKKSVLDKKIISEKAELISKAKIPLMVSPVIEIDWIYAINTGNITKKTPLTLALVIIIDGKIDSVYGPVKQIYLESPMATLGKGIILEPIQANTNKIYHPSFRLLLTRTAEYVKVEPHDIFNPKKV